jgi:hypothetical protein
MTALTFNLTGSKVDVETALAEIAALPGVEAVNGTPSPAVGSIMSRGRQHQVELVECIVSVILSLATSAAYDGLKLAVVAIAKKRNVESEAVDESRPQ